MSAENRKILCQVSNLAGTNPDIYNIIKLACLEWSDETTDSLLDTYDYVVKHKPIKLKSFVGWMAGMVKVSN